MPLTALITVSCIANKWKSLLFGCLLLLFTRVADLQARASALINQHAFHFDCALWVAHDSVGIQVVKSKKRLQSFPLSLFTVFSAHRIENGFSATLRWMSEASCDATYRQTTQHIVNPLTVNGTGDLNIDQDLSIRTFDFISVFASKLIRGNSVRKTKVTILLWLWLPKAKTKNSKMSDPAEEIQ